MSASGFSIGKEPRKFFYEKSEQFPGVGAYDNSNEKIISKIHRREPMYSIGKTQRIRTQSKGGSPKVGPNSYNVLNHSVFNAKGRGFSMIGKTKPRIASEGPGPGSYDGCPKKYSNKYSFGLKTSYPSLKGGRPGPGDYNIDKKQKSISVSFQLSQRANLTSHQQKLPGPGTYLKTEMSNTTKNKFSFKKANKFFEEEMQEQKYKVIPGPGNYNTNINQVKKRVISQKFNKTKRKILTTQGPGPAAYTTTNSPFKRSPVATIGNSPKSTPPKNKSPGPGQYQQSYIPSKRAPTIIFPKAKLSSHQQEVVPGPGSYQLNDLKPSSRYYSMSGKNSVERKQKSPDPFSYNVNYDSVCKRPENSIIGKAPKLVTERTQNPGPNVYNTEYRTTSKAFFFPKQTKPTSKNLSPGPGAYNISK